MDIKDKVRNREIHYNDINKANFDLIPLFFKDKNNIKFKSYNELIHTIIMLYLYVGAIYNSEVTVIDTVSHKMPNNTYSFYVNPILVSPTNVINKLRGQRFDGEIVLFIKPESGLGPILEDDILNSIRMSSRRKTHIITCVL